MCLVLRSLGIARNESWVYLRRSTLRKCLRYLISSAIGSLMYAMMCTCPGICYIVRLVRRFQSNLGLKHWMEVRRILRYLEETLDYVLCYQGKDLRLASYTNADWGGNLDQHKSTYGYASLLNDCGISWSTKKQCCINLSTLEAEYVACSLAIH